jgi:hypothetical protein
MVLWKKYREKFYRLFTKDGEIAARLQLFIIIIIQVLQTCNQLRRC